MNNELIEKFNKDYKEYTNACINFSLVQENYEPLSFDRDLEWMNQWFKKHQL